MIVAFGIEGGTICARDWSLVNGDLERERERSRLRLGERIGDLEGDGDRRRGRTGERDLERRIER